MEVTAPLRRLRERRELAAARRAADAELIATRLPSPRLAWRTRELIADEHRREIAHALVTVVHGADGRHLPGSSPLNRVAVRAEEDRLLFLAAVLADVSRPVRPQGVLLVDRLLSDGSGPLYARHRERQLAGALREAIAALEATH